MRENPTPQSPVSEPVPAGQATDKMVALLEAELERLKAELEVYRAGEHPERRTLIRNSVARIDEREDALDALRRSFGESA